MDLTTWTPEQLEARNNELGAQQNTLRDRRAAALAEAESAFLRDREPIRAERAAIAAELSRRAEEAAQ